MTELVSKTNPSGIIPINEATVPKMASPTFPFVAFIWLKYIIIPIGIINIERIFNSFSKELMMTEFAFFSYFASLEMVAT